jgi:hypothetical protein
MISSKSLKNKELQHFSPLSTTFPHLPPLWAYFGLGQAFICVFVNDFKDLGSGELRTELIKTGPKTTKTPCGVFKKSPS